MNPPAAARIVEIRSRKTLLEMGNSASELKTRVKKGELQRIYRGTYVRTRDMESLRAESKYRLRALAVAARSPQLVLSHVSAVAVHKLPLFGVRTHQVHLTRRARTGTSRTEVRVVHATELRDCEIVSVENVLLTSVARSLFDFARTVSLESAVVAMDYALHAGMVTLSELTELLAAFPRSKGAPSARRVFGATDGRSESPGESRARLILNELPGLESQIHILDAKGNEVGRVDLGFPELGVLIEFDGKEKYVKYLRPGQTSSDAVEEERQRENRIRELGYIVVRITWAELANPEAILARVRKALALARRRLELGGCDGTFWVEPRVG